MKILQVIPFFAPAWDYGGPVKVSLELSRELKKRGFAVTVLTTDAREYSNRVKTLCEEMDGVSVLRFKNISNRLAKRLNLFAPRGFAKYVRHNLRNFDVIHLHAFFTYQNIIAAKYCRKYKIPYILHLHEMPIPISLFKKSLIKKIFNRLYGKRLLCDAAKIFVVSSLEKKRLIEFMPQLEKKIEVISNPYVLTKIIPAKENRAEFGLEEADKVILFFGRLSFIKGLDRLVRAFAELSKRDPSYKLILAGPDEGEKERLEAQIRMLKIEESVIFTGFLEGKKKAEIFLISDLFALFSYYESFSLSTLEALSYGLPVCLTREVGIANEVLPFGCGKLISRPDDATSSAEDLKYVYNNKDKLARGCRAASKQFEIKPIVDKIIKIYRQI